MRNETPSQINFTVVVPTYNGAKRLPQVLDHLQSQTHTEQVTWEVVVVDNNSTDETAKVVQQYQQSWRNDVPLRYVFERQQGLAYARQCGIDAAHGELIGFLDDDNWPSADWVAQAKAFSDRYPKAGSYGGMIAGVFETQPEQELQPLLRFLAIRNHGKTEKAFDPQKMQFPPGAGLVVRKTAWQSAVPLQLLCVTRGGDDYEISMRMARQGWEIWYNPAMSIQHFIPAKRLTRNYLRRLAHFYGLCTCKLITIDIPYWKQPALLLKSFLGSCKRITSHYLRYRLDSRKTAEADCMLAFHYGNLKSPFFYLATMLGLAKFRPAKLET
ncbi:MAG: hormogonium polysaccharide biosynthesis glycosyltransferase HpsE [Cyanobacteria bacterium J06632_3]